MPQLFKRIRQILNFLNENSKNKLPFPSFHPSSFSHINLHLVCPVSRGRILSTKSVIDTRNFYHSRKSDKSASRQTRSPSYQRDICRRANTVEQFTDSTRVFGQVGTFTWGSRIDLRLYPATRRISGNYSKQTRPRVADR